LESPLEALGVTVGNILIAPSANGTTSSELRKFAITTHVYHDSPHGLGVTLKMVIREGDSTIYLPLFLTTSDCTVHPPRKYTRSPDNLPDAPVMPPPSDSPAAGTALHCT
jgi:hypothetical protein